MPTALCHERLIDFYRTMRLIRETEEALARAHAKGLVHGACHTYVGQEAVTTGVCANLRADDVVFSTHRGHGHALAKGVSPQALAAELFGRASGVSGGRGGSMHLFSPEVGLLGTSGIVGPCILQAAGAAYAFRVLSQPRVAVAFFGDGAVNNGAFHEGLNMAAIWKLPVIFVCENNRYATEVPFDYACGNANVGQRGAMYGIAGVTLDGNDVLAIEAAASEAIDRARHGAGPTLLECQTYRTRPHAEGMGDFTYRTREEVDEWRKKCPIARLRGRILERDASLAGALDDVDRATTDHARQAIESAERSPWPDASMATRHVYCESPPGDRTRSAELAVSPPPGDRQISYGKATHEALSAAMERDPAIFVLGEGIGKRGGNFATTPGMFERFGALRLCDTPICERGFTGLACGAAMVAARPLVDYMFADFFLDGIGEIVNQIAKMQYMSSGRLKMPLVLRACIGIGHSAATHHSGSYYSLLAAVPGLKVAVPASPYDAKGLLAAALQSPDPVVFLEHRELLSSKGPVPAQDYTIPFGQAVVVRAGRDVTVVGISRMVQHALSAAAELAKESIDVEIIDPRTILPLDIDTIAASVAKTGRLLVIDETTSPCSIGGEIAAQIAEHCFDDLDAPIRRLHGAFAPTPYSPTLEAAIVPGPANVAAAVRQLLAE